MAVLLMMICLIITALGVVREREIGTLDQLLVSPITPSELILGKTIPVLGLGMFHLLIYLGVMAFQFGVPMRGSFATLVLAAFLYVATALALGLLISTVSRTQQEAFMLLVLFLLPSVVLSGFLSPVESMPTVFRWIVAIDPLRYFLDISRGLLLKGIGLAELWPQYLALTLMASSAFFFSIRRFGKMIS
jgi:ABC-2 type transport system permease protein